MSCSEQTSIEDFNDFNNINPIDVFEYPCKASKIIWDINSNNVLQQSLQIIELIKSNKIPINMVFHLVDIYSNLRWKDIGNFGEFSLKILNEFSCHYIFTNRRLRNLLYL